MKKFLPKDKPDIRRKIKEHIGLKKKQRVFLNECSTEDIVDIFFSILSKPQNVSAISQKASLMGFSENNMIFDGKTDSPGDHISISRWAKAASGSLIIPLRYNDSGNPEILFGKKKQNSDMWVLPGGHYELDEHKNLDHTLVAELMEETGIIPYSDEFKPYILSTLEHAKDLLPYKTIEEAMESFVSERFTCNLETVLSGAGLGYKKRIILAVYSIIFHDGSKLNPHPNDDITKLKWFSIQDIISGNKENQFSLSALVPAHYRAVKYLLTRMGLL